MAVPLPIIMGAMQLAAHAARQQQQSKGDIERTRLAHAARLEAQQLNYEFELQKLQLQLAHDAEIDRQKRALATKFLETCQHAFDQKMRMVERAFDAGIDLLKAHQASLLEERAQIIAEQRSDDGKSTFRHNERLKRLREIANELSDITDKAIIMQTNCFAVCQELSIEFRPDIAPLLTHG